MTAVGVRTAHRVPDVEERLERVSLHEFTGIVGELRRADERDALRGRVQTHLLKDQAVVGAADPRMLHLAMVSALIVVFTGPVAQQAGQPSASGTVW